MGRGEEGIRKTRNEKLDTLSVKTNCQINPHFKAGSFKENVYRLAKG